MAQPLVARTETENIRFKAKYKQVADLMEEVVGEVLAFESRLQDIHHEYKASFGNLRARASSISDPDHPDADASLDDVRDRGMIRALAKTVPLLLESHAFEPVSRSGVLETWQAIIRQLFDIRDKSEVGAQSKQVSRTLRAMLNATFIPQTPVREESAPVREESVSRNRKYSGPCLEVDDADEIPAGSSAVYKGCDVVRVKKVYYDDDPPYYGIEMPDGSEKQTVRANLGKIDLEFQQKMQQLPPPYSQSVLLCLNALESILLPPAPPSPDVSEVTATSVLVQVHKPLHGGAVVEYELQWRHLPLEEEEDEDDWGGTQNKVKSVSSSFPLGCLSNGASYQVRARCCNLIGYGKWGPPGRFTTQLYDMHFQSFMDRLDEQREALKAEASCESLNIKVGRDMVLEDSLVLLVPEEASYEGIVRGRWKRKFSITFLNEAGCDAGGLLKEWFTLAAHRLFDPQHGFFVATGGMLHPRENSAALVPEIKVLTIFRFAGRLLGKALLERVPLRVHLTSALLKRLLGREPGLEDMKTFDEELFRSFQLVLNADTATVDSLMMTFSTETHVGGRRAMVDLKPNGRHIMVTQENKADYIRGLVLHKLQGGVEEELHEIEAGFLELVPSHILDSLDVSDLSLALGGTSAIDADDWERNTDYLGFKQMDSHRQTKAWFWQAIRSMSDANRQRFLQFATGQPVPPPGGFAAGFQGFQFTISAVDTANPGMLPEAHTCFASVDLPTSYSSFAMMQQRLNVCLQCVTFGLH